jgi:hypothetical protein
MSNIKIEFISEFNDIKKGEIKEFSKDICKIFVDELKVAIYHTEVIKEKAKKVNKIDKKE